MAKALTDQRKKMGPKEFAKAITRSSLVYEISRRLLAKPGTVMISIFNPRDNEYTSFKRA
jgi:hypothetical protein